MSDMTKAANDTMSIERLEQLREWMSNREDEHWEFKEAKGNYEFEKLVDYSVALANEGGGKFILGVTDKRPRRVVGTKAFQDLQRTATGILDRIHLRVDVDEVMHPDGRVLVFHIPSRPIGVPIHDKGTYWMRSGEDLVPMSADQLKRIFDEAQPDFSASICHTAVLNDLDTTAIERFRELWLRKSSNQNLATLSIGQLLTDAELINADGITYAALILLGTRQALGKHLAQGEVIFEYRSSEASGPAAQREEFRQASLLTLDTVWNLISLRNDKQPFQDGLVIFEIPTFNERAIREAVLNAIVHRDYRLSGSVFVRQYPRRLEIVSPGGFPTGITEENILWKQLPRNRRIAEAIARCGLVERSGQGVNRMFEECIREGKLIPDFSGTDDYEVWVTLHGEVQDERFLRFLEKVGRERLNSFITEDFLLLDLVHRDQVIPSRLKHRIPYLIDQGVIELAGDSRCILSRAFYSFLGQKGVYTRKRGLDRETNKALLLKHIEDNNTDGSKLDELLQVLPSLSRDQVQSLLRELKRDALAFNLGRTKAARWYVGIKP